MPLVNCTRLMLSIIFLPNIERLFYQIGYDKAAVGS